MPIALDPAERYRYVFSTDREKPADEQPAFFFHFPTCREMRTIAKLLDDAITADSIDEQLRLRLDAMRVILCGWENIADRQGQPMPFDPAKLDDVLTDSDITELNIRMLRELGLSEIEKKRSAYERTNKQASSAKDAAPANAADPAPASPPNSNA